MKNCLSTDIKKVMILGGGPLQVPAIKIVNEMGMHTIVCDYDENAIGFKYADEHYLISTIDEEKICEKAKELNVDYVITSTSDAPVRTVAYVCEKLGLPVGITYESAVCATIKSAMRDRLKEQNVSIPQYYVCKNYDEFVEAVNQFENMECILKPSDSAASRGVSLIDGRLSNEQMKERYETCIQNSKNKIVLVEEFMRGPEVSVESFVINGETHIITITDKLVTEVPYFVELGHSEPSNLPKNVIESIKDITKKAIAAIGIKNGVSHTEVKITQNGPKIVEIAARLGGDYITSKLVPLSTGVDMVKNSVALALHRETDISIKKNQGSAIRFIPGKKGIVKSVHINDAVYKLKGLEEIEVFVKPGEVVNDTHSSNDRLGYVITSGSDATEAISIAECVLGYIKIEIVEQN